MTEQEAIKKHIEECRDRIDVIQAYMKANNEDANVKRCERNILILEITIQTLEKQIPKKIERINNGEELLCPCCGIDFMGAINDADHDPYHCFECGQALDWRNEDAE